MRQVIVVFGLVLAACGGGSSPSSPTPQPLTPPAPVVQVQVSPNPLSATLKTAGSTSSTFEVAPQITFKETAGGSGRITKVYATVVRMPGSQSTNASLAVNLSFSAYGSVSDGYTQKFEVTAETTGVSWKFYAEGTDAQGRAFTTATAEVTVNPPARSTPPPTYPSPSGRILLFGGTNYGTYIGCFSCNEFDYQSIHNQFGIYGSKYSSTSIFNSFSAYGSPYSSTSACNPYASNPPRFRDEATGQWGPELTLNTYRANAMRDSTIIAWLQRVVCAN